MITQEVYKTCYVKNSVYKILQETLDKNKIKKVYFNYYNGNENTEVEEDDQ